LVAYVHQGVGAIDFFAAAGDDYGLAPSAFLSGQQAQPGEPLSALQRLSTALALARKRPRARPLSVESVADAAGHTQFTGDGTAAHPSLYDRDVLAALPFALADRDWVVPIYVMTRDLRHDLPAEAFRVSLGGLDGRRARASLYDPLTGRFEPLAISARRRDGLTVDLRATDSPRLLFLSG
jgi:hypothetical protein